MFRVGLCIRAVRTDKSCKLRKDHFLILK
uniref:Uncharacterized protein n=1 Tax=Anguilla anguilla TaxID=7936 RepID=A0A0E9QL26_ANGAN